MDFTLSDERRMLQEGLRRYVARSVGSHGAADDAALWLGLAEMGVIGALFAEADGGFGGAGFDLAVVFEEMGRAGAVAPLLETGILGGGLVAATGRSRRRDLLDAVIAGRCQLALAHGEPAARYDLSHVETRVEGRDGGYEITGRKSVVANAPAAGHLVVSARSAGEVADEGGLDLFLLPRGLAGVEMHAAPMLGGGHCAEILLDAVRVGPEARLGPEGGAFAALETARVRAVLGICAEALGLMEAIKALTADHLRTRRQFGQPIGKFQALQHRMADLMIGIEQSRSAVINLASHLDGPRDLRERHVSASKVLIGETGQRVAEESIQMHGGIGMTRDYALGHLAKRLIAAGHRFGDAMFYLERFIGLSVA